MSFSDKAGKFFGGVMSVLNGLCGYAYKHGGSEYLQNQYDETTSQLDHASRNNLSKKEINNLQDRQEYLENSMEYWKNKH